VLNHQRRGDILPEFDYLVVGAGWYGSVFARQMTDAGYKCLVIDRRPHIGGNSFTENVDGIHVHRYGPHLFHTNNEGIWNYVNRFAKFLPFTYRGCASFRGQEYSFPINLTTFQQVCGVHTQEEAEQYLALMQVPNAAPQNLEEWVLSQVGEEFYRMFIYGYTTKQWDREPKRLPASIIKRIPIRTIADDRYFNDKYQGIPEGGYTAIFDKLLAGSKVQLDANYFCNRDRWERLADRIVYTGRIDEFFDYCCGALEYRTLRFETRRMEIPYYQKNAVINFTDIAVPYTRVVEHKYFDGVIADHTMVTWEYPESWTQSSEPYYPINDDQNQLVYNVYHELGKRRNSVIFGGRLGSYRYYDMHQVIGAALGKAQTEMQRRELVNAEDNSST
jgi:UDP-galactopyranose mutase